MASVLGKVHSSSVYHSLLVAYFLLLVILIVFIHTVWFLNRVKIDRDEDIPFPSTNRRMGGIKHSEDEPSLPV